MSRKPHRPKLRVYLPPELHHALREQAAAEEVSMAHIIRALVPRNLQSRRDERPLQSTQAEVNR
jgi:predicted HicB family RNase H-like nuclease